MSYIRVFRDPEYRFPLEEPIDLALHTLREGFVNSYEGEETPFAPLYFENISDSNLRNVNFWATSLSNEDVVSRFINTEIKPEDLIQFSLSPDQGHTTKSKDKASSIFFDEIIAGQKFKIYFRLLIPQDAREKLELESNENLVDSLCIRFHFEGEIE